MRDEGGDLEVRLDELTLSEIDVPLLDELSVAHGIVKAHGGCLTAASEQGEGATFEIYLPRAEAPVGGVEDECALQTGGGESILLVDDEPIVAGLLQRVLERYDYRVTAFGDSRQALEALKAAPGSFDVVVTDYTMPNMTGTALARELSRIEPKVPVILVSGYGDLVDKEEIRRSGIQTLLTKPIRHHELTAAIRRELERVEQTSVSPRVG